jgi:hypothetical protein
LRLADSLDKLKIEYSSITWYGKDKLLLIPQYLEENVIRVVDTAEIGRALNNTNYRITGKPLPINGLDKLKESLGIAGSSCYQGIEAASIMNDTVFLAIETCEDSDYSYFIRGVISEEQVKISPEIVMRLMKPKNTNNLGSNIYNAGFESLAFLPDGRLLTIFEYNRQYADKPTAYTFTTMLDKTSVVPLDMDSLNFRLTDITVIDSFIYGLNFFYKGSKDYAAYIHGNPVKERDLDKHLVKRINQKKTCYCRIVQFQIKGNRLIRTGKEYELFQKCTNMEGMVKFRDGFLVISDNFPPGNVLTELHFYRIN